MNEGRKTVNSDFTPLWREVFFPQPIRTEIKFVSKQNFPIRNIMKSGFATGNGGEKVKSEVLV